MGTATAAIMARLGLDVGDFNRQLAASAGAADAGGKKMAKGLTLAHEANEHLLASSHRVARSITSVAQGFANGASGAELFAGSLEGLEKALHLPLGALAGLGIGAVALEGISKAVEEAKKLREELNGLTMDSTPSGSRTESDIEKSLEKAKELRAELTRQLQHPFWNAVKDIAFDPYVAAFGGDVTDNGTRRKQADQAEEQEKKFKDQLAEKEQTIADIADKRLKIGELAAERAKMEADYAEKIGAAMRKDGNGKPENPALATAYENHRATDRLALDEKEKSLQRQLDYEHQILAIKQEGVDVDLKSARAKVDHISDQFEAASDEDKPKVHVEMEAAVKELTVAEQITAARKMHFEMEMAIAGLTGDELQKRRQILDLQKQDIKARLDQAVGDDKKPIEIEQAHNKTEFKNLARQEAEQSESTTQKWNASTEGRGAQERLRVLDLQIASTQRLIDLNRTSGDYDAAYDAEKSAALNDQLKTRHEIQFADEQQIAAVKASVAQMELENTGQTNAAKQAGIRAGYEAQIKTALDNQNTALATQLTKMQNIALNAAAIANYLKTPEQKRAEAADAAAHGRAARTVAARAEQAKEDKAKNAPTDFKKTFGHGDSDFLGPPVPTRGQQIQQNTADFGKSDAVIPKDFHDAEFHNATVHVDKFDILNA